MNALVRITERVAMNALTLRLQDEMFAIEAGEVREILDLVPITHVPNAPAFVQGLINVRGRVVPLADLRVVFGMKRPDPDANTRIIVIEIDILGDPTIVGVLADDVHEVSEIEAGAIEDAPRVGMRWRPDFVRGIGKRNGKFIIIPDLGRILGSQSARRAPVNSDERPAS